MTKGSKSPDERERLFEQGTCVQQLTNVTIFFGDIIYYVRQIDIVTCPRNAQLTCHQDRFCTIGEPQTIALL